MKSYLIQIVFLFIILASSMAFADVNSSMQRGNEYYKNNQYQLAIDEYNKLVNQGYEGTSVFYNLGNAHYRLGHIGYAILYFEKALKLTPGDEDSKHNLAVAKLNIKDKVDTLPPFFIFNIWEDLLASFFRIRMDDCYLRNFYSTAALHNCVFLFQVSQSTEIIIFCIGRSRHIINSCSGYAFSKNQ